MAGCAHGPGLVAKGIGFPRQTGPGLMKYVGIAPAPIGRQAWACESPPLGTTSRAKHNARPHRKCIHKAMLADHGCNPVRTAKIRATTCNGVACPQRPKRPLGFSGHGAMFGSFAEWFAWSVWASAFPSHVVAHMFALGIGGLAMLGQNCLVDAFGAGACIIIRFACGPGGGGVTNPCMPSDWCRSDADIVQAFLP